MRKSIGSECIIHLLNELGAVADLMSEILKVGRKESSQPKVIHRRIYIRRYLNNKILYEHKHINERGVVVPVKLFT